MAASVALAFVYTLPSFAHGQIASWDGPAHLVRAEHFWRSLDLESLGVWGWYHGWYLGVAPFLFYPPGFFFVLASAKAATFGLASMSLLTKVVVALTFAAFPAALSWFGRAVGLSTRAAAAAAALSLGCSADLGVGLQGIYGIGLYTQAFSLLLFLGFLGVLVRCIRGEASAVRAGLWLAAVLLTSVVTAAFSILAATIVWASSGAWRSRLPAMRLAAVFAVALSCAAFWLLPFVRSLPLAGPETGFPALALRELLSRFLLGGVVVPLPTAVLAAVGTLVCLFRARTARPERSAYLALVALFTAALVFGSSLPASLLASGWLGRLLRSVLRARVLAFLWVFAPLLAGVAVDAVLDACLRKGVRFARGLKLAVPAALILLGARQLSDQAHAVRTLEHPAFAEGLVEWRGALAWLRAHARPQSLVLTDINWGALHPLGTVSIDSLLNLEAGMRSLRGNQIEATQIDGWRLDRLRFRTRADEVMLRRFGVDYVVMYEKPFYWPAYLEPVLMSEHMVVYRVLPGATPPLALEPGRNRYRAHVRVEREQALELPVQYNDHWTARVGGEQRAVTRSDLGLVQLDVPIGDSEIELVFRRNALEKAACLFSLASLCLCLASLARERHAFRPAA